MRHPYGIWNTRSSKQQRWEQELWDIPMGFETIKIKKVWRVYTYYETSLWDLKLQNWGYCWFWNGLWDIPMGFETFVVLTCLAKCLIMRHPYGIWNYASTKTERTTVPLWDIPMGFETRWRHRNTAGGCIMRHPYGIWNWLSLRETVRLWTLWDIPMGFETWSQHTWNRYGADYETSLWDLKLVKYQKGMANNPNYETSLWDLKLVKLWKLNHSGENYETSLWDLKRSKLISRSDDKPIMRHPYGIWNLLMTSSLFYLRHYETSLWDLKLDLGINNMVSEVNYETSLWDLKLASDPDADYPKVHYETSLWDLKLKRGDRCSGCWNYYETSLWDLKHSVDYKAAGEEFNYETSLWDLKLVKYQKGMANNPIMRHPYGIWNALLLHAVPDAVVNYETSLWDLKLKLQVVFDGLVNYETSLWDLKLSIMSGVYKFAILWDIPMGFETFPKFFRRAKNLRLWDIPMGFETCICQKNIGLKYNYETSLWDLKQLFGCFGFYGWGIMRHPYGIWN